MNRIESKGSARPRQWNRIIVFASVAFAANTASAALEVLPNSRPQSVFAGGSREIAVALRNSGDQPVDCSLSARILQTSSASVVSVAEVPWKTLRVLAGQTVSETAVLDFPNVRGETRFLVEWLGQTNRVLGATDVFVYPTNLLQELKRIAGSNDALGVLDERNELKPLLQSQKVDFVDLGNTELQLFRGKLAVICPVATRELAASIRAMARKGVAVVWIVRPQNPRDKLRPSFYSVPEGSIAIVIAQPELIANLPENPQSQLNLIRLCALAVRPEALTLPESN